MNNRVACKCNAGDYSNEHSPLLLSEDCSYSQLPILIHSSKYIVRKLTVDGKEFEVMGPNEEFWVKMKLKHGLLTDICYSLDIVIEMFAIPK